MSSSSSALTRSRSMRNPSGKTERDGDAPRTTSPSRLPVKGIAPGSTDRSARTTSTTAGIKSSGRPLSGVFGRIKQAATATQDATATSATTGRPLRTTRPPTTRPTSSSGPSSTSTSRPTTSSGVPASAAGSRSRVPSGHGRTKSSVTTLTGATILRPPSQGSVGSASSTATATHTQTDRSRPPISSSTRTAAAHRRQPSSSSSTTTSTSLAPRRPTREQPPQPQLQPQPGNIDSAGPRLRPAFTTLQQHYSPAKSLAPKPLTATFLAPPSPSKLPANVALSAETARLQTELLQLHLLHRDAAAVQTQWRDSARQKLGRRFAELVAREQEAGRAEAEAVERVNAAALVAWGGSSKGMRLEERVQILDGVVCGLWALGETPGGRYARVVRRFEKWVGRVEEAWEVRKTKNWAGMLTGLDQGLSTVLVGELDAQWKEECAGLVRRLDEWRRQIQRLEDGEEDDGESSLGRMLGACRVLVHDMLAELDLMDTVEREVVREERRWVREMNRGMDGGGEDTARAGAGAIWRGL